MTFVPDPLGDPGDAEVALLENLRFAPGETSKDDLVRSAFAARLAALADVYVDDAFGSVHRKHASVYDVALRLPHAAGGLVLREVEMLSRLTQSPIRPFVVVLGGSKVSDKLPLLHSLVPNVDRLLIGGGMCFTFLLAQGHQVANSLVEPDSVENCRTLLASGKVMLPADFVVAATPSEDAVTEVVSTDSIPAGMTRPRHWPGQCDSVCRRHPQRAHRVLERADGSRRG